jgi:hypothetical protein
MAGHYTEALLVPSTCALEESTAALTDHVLFNDRALARTYENKRIPISTLYEAYFDGALEIADLQGFLAERNRFVSHCLTVGHLRWALTHFLPEVMIHSRRLDRKLVSSHYDRGDDFFHAFLGDTMVYSAAWFEEPSSPIDEAQTNKLDRVCRKLQLRPGERLLDLGCGWGALVVHAAQHYGVDATGVTVSTNQARVVCMDYRDLPTERFDKIASLEMVEHVGVRHLSRFFRGVAERLHDDGIFLLQWSGLRREDLIWGLFMNRYITPGPSAVGTRTGCAIARRSSRATANAGSESGTSSSPGRRSSASRATAPVCK